MKDFTDDMTLLDARNLLRELIVDGEKCPCCAQFAKIYKRKIHSSMGAAMISIYRESYWNKKGFVEIANFLPHNQVADAAKLRYWGLIEEEPSVRSDGSERTGFWRVTLEGMEFVRGVRKVPKYALLYDGRCLGFEGEEVAIKESVGTKFDFNELMAGL